jgi:hypothetical protein
MARVFETDITLNAQRELRLADADSSAYVGFKAPSTITTNRIWTLPSADGTTGQVLSTDGSGTLSWATAGGGGGLTHFVESEETASPNDTVPVDALTATDASYTNIDAALVAKGTGATLAQVPDGATAGGSKRGTYATDLQKARASSGRVASGNYSVIAGGYGNGTSGGYASTVGGFSNTASTNYSFVGGGQTNEAKTNTHATCVGGTFNDATGGYSFVGGGQAQIASGLYSSISGGRSNTASSSYAAVSGGFSNTASAYASFVGGGESNLANASHSFIAGGKRGSTRLIDGYHVFPACNIPIANTAGVTQSALLLLARETTDATATVLTSNTSAASTTNQVILPNNSAYHFKGSVIATVTGGGDTASWEFKGAIKRGANAASTAIVGTVIKDVVAYDAGASAWDVTFTADTTNGGLKVEVTGAAATTIRWVAKLETTEVTY